MGWFDTWVMGNEGRGSGWWAVVFWAGAVAAFDVLITSFVWSSNHASGVFLVVVSVLAWIWVLMGLRRPKMPPGPTDRRG